MKFLLFVMAFSSTIALAKEFIIEAKDKVYHTGLIHPQGEKAKKKKYMDLGDCTGVPDSFDLRELGVVPPVRDQGQCGSCWAFSKTASLESAMLGKGKALDLSEQELVSCDKDQLGCDGGYLDDFKYQIKSGEALEGDFPYRAADLRCRGGLKPAAKGVSFAYVGAEGRMPTDDELKCALYKTHTIPWITVSASNAWGSPPKSEKSVYNNCGRGQTNHAVGVVGYFKQKSGKTAYIMRNSWGIWGDAGYMSIELGCDSFGDEVAFIVAE